MEQVQIQASETRALLDSSNHFYQDLLGYSPEQTSLQQIPEAQWDEFATQRGLAPNSSGIYLPRNQTAVIRNENPLSLFHEYFGHGLYCEQNLAGRKLVELEKRLLEEEKQEFSSRRFTLEDLQRFRKENKTSQELENFRQDNLGRYELFAIWTEYLLSGESNLREDFERKYDSLSGQEKEAVDSVINFSEQYGNLATFYSQGMARRTTMERVGGLLEDVYKEKLQDVKFALLYGSKKEFSDIDIFMVGEGNLNFRNEWMDIFSISVNRFEYEISSFDVSITDPLFTGEFVFGDKEYLEFAKNKLITQPITQEAIYSNLIKAKQQEFLSLEHPNNSKERLIGKLFFKTYLANALALKEGKRIFTKRDLLHSKRASAEGDKPLQLQGGKNK